MIRCSNCGEFKVEYEFRLRKDRNKDYSRCKKCENKANLYRHHHSYKTREDRKKSIRKYNLKRYYNLSLEEYEQMEKKQNGACAICSNTETRLFVDHCHATGKIRALLCEHCNRGLGGFKDDPERLRKAAAFIESFNM